MFASIIQVFAPGVTVSLSSATAVGATSFTVSDASAFVAGDAFTVEIGQNADYLTVSSVSGNVVTTTSGAQNAHAAGVGVFRPGPFTKTAGTPALLVDIEAQANDSNTDGTASRGAYEAEWTWMQQGGLDAGTFYLHKKYEDHTDLVFGNYIVFACEGGTIHADASSGASSITVDNLESNTNDTTGLSVLDIKANDPIVISDGVNSELFLASSVTGSGPWTIHLASAPGAGNSTLLNAYTVANGTKVCRLRYQGIIQSRQHTTDKTNMFQLSAVGVFNRYGQAIGNSTQSQVDGAGLLSDIVTSYKYTLPEIIVDSANLSASSIPVTVTEQDAHISQIIADILKQEAAMVPSQSNSGLTISPTSLDFPQVTSAVQYAKVNGGTSPYSATSSDTSVATVSLIGSDAVNTTTVKNTVSGGASSIVVNTTTKTIGTTGTTSNTGSLAAGDVVLIDGGTSSAEFATIASVNSGTSTLTFSSPLAYSHAAGANVVQYLSVKVTAKGTGTATITITDAGSLTVTCTIAVGVAIKGSAGTLWAAWVDELRQIHHGIIPTAGTPTYTLDLNTGSADGDILGPLVTTDMDGSSLMNAAIVRGGQDANGNRIRISVIETFSQQMLNAWYEGTLDNTDITDEQSLANWAAGQLAIMAYPLITAQLDLTSASGRWNTTDLIEITGFDDGSTLLANPVGMKFLAKAQEQRITAQASLGVLGPDTEAVAREYASQRAIRETYNTPKTNLSETFVLNGFTFTETGGVGFTIGTGNVVYQGDQYGVSTAYTGSAPVGDSMYGVEVLNGTATIIQMPMATALGLISTTAQYHIHYRGGPPEIRVGGSNIIPLYKVSASDTAILGYQYIGQQGTSGADWNEFKGTLRKDGSWTDVDGSVANTTIPASSSLAGAVIHTEAVFTKGANTGGFVFPGSGTQQAGSGIYIYNGTTGYFCVWQPDGNFVLYQNDAGTVTALDYAYFPAMNQSDTAPHRVQLTLTLITGSQVSATASIDNAGPLTGSGLTGGSLIGNAISCQISTGGSTGTVRQFSFSGGVQHYETAPIAVKKRILPDNTLVVDGTTGPVSGNLPHLNMATSYTGNFDSSGVLQSSETMNSKVPNSSAYFQDFTWEWSYTYHTGTPNYYLFNIWYDNGAAGTNATIYLPNYNTTPGDRDIDIACTTSASPSVSGFQVNSGQSLYLMAYYIPGVGMHIQASVSPFTAAQIRTVSQDGGYITAFATVGTGAVFTPSGTSGGTGSASGNGGHIPSKF